jgi:hypothetical protein
VAAVSGSESNNSSRRHGNTTAPAVARRMLHIDMCCGLIPTDADQLIPTDALDGDSLIDPLQPTGFSPREHAQFALPSPSAAPP